MAPCRPAVLTYEPGTPAGRIRRNRLRPRLSDQGDRHHDARDAARGAPGPAPADPVSPAAGMAAAAIAPTYTSAISGALQRPDGMDAVLSRPAGPRRHDGGICALPLEYVPWTQPLQRPRVHAARIRPRGRRRRPLDRSSQPMAGRTRAPLRRARRVARTDRADRDRSWRGRLLVGEVHDENAWALGGVAGTRACSAPRQPSARSRAACSPLRGSTGLARRETLARFVTRSTVPQFARARLGHHAAHVLLRRASLGARVRATPASPARRSGSIRAARSLRRAAHEPRPPVARGRAARRAAPARPRRRCRRTRLNGA